MKTEVENLSPVQKRISIEVPADEVGAETSEVLELYRKKAKLPGFRPGKAPIQLVRAKFGKDVREEVRDRLMARTFHDVAKDNGLRPIGEPAVDDLKFDDDGPLSFKATFEVLPEFELKGYKDVELRRSKPTLEDAEMDKALEDLRQARTSHVTEEGREAVVGDVVVADFEGTPVGEGEPFKREGMPIEVGAENNLPAFNEHLPGTKEGSEVEFRVEYPEDFGSKELAGKTIDFKFLVHEVKRREVPELNDDFARDLGEFDDLAALRERVREDLQARKDHEEEHAAKQAVLEKVMVDNPVVLPDVLVQREIRGRLEEVVRSMMMRGMDPEKTEVDWEELRKGQEEPARRMVHAGLILDAVAREEKLEVDGKAVDERIRLDAQRLGEKPETLRERVNEQDGMEGLKNQLLRDKALDYLTSVANIQYLE